MKIAVTGATGFIGRYLVPHLLNQGHACRAWVRPGYDRAALPPGNVEWVTGQLNDAQATRSLLEGTDAVIHTALDRPGTAFRGAEGDVIDFAETNVVGTLRLFDSARTAGVPRFVFISTCAVHERILDDRPLDEAHPTWPTSHYGAHKAALEMFVHSYGWGEGYPICALRPTGVYGLTHPVEHSKWYSLVEQVANGEDVECSRGGKEVHASDVAKAAELLLHADSIAGECFNCYDRYISEFDVATLAKEISGSQATIHGDARSPRHQIVTDKLRALGMQFGGDDLLRQTIDQLMTAVQRTAR